MNVKEVEEAFAQLGEEEKVEFLSNVQDVMPIPTDLPLVYSNADGTEEVIAKFIRSRSSDIKAIVLGGKAVALGYEKRSNWEMALKAAADKKGSLMKHFDGDCGRFFAEKTKFNATIDVLLENGVKKAEKWRNGRHWCHEEYDEDSAFVCVMDIGTVSGNAKSSTSGNVRVVWNLS